MRTKKLTEQFLRRTMVLILMAALLCGAGTGKVSAAQTEAQLHAGPVLMVTDYEVIEGDRTPGSSFLLEMHIANLSRTAWAYDVVATLTVENLSVSLQDIKNRPGNALRIILVIICNRKTAAKRRKRIFDFRERLGLFAIRKGNHHKIHLELACFYRRGPDWLECGGRHLGRLARAKFRGKIHRFIARSRQSPERDGTRHRQCIKSNRISFESHP